MGSLPLLYVQHSLSTSPHGAIGFFSPVVPTRRTAWLVISCSKTTTKTESRRADDDCHATIRSLNFKGRFPRKSLGQHYMLNPSINEPLVCAADVREGDVVLQIGPGTGSLTNVLVNYGAFVLAIEKDPHMATLVRERFSSTERVKVVEEDFTRFHIQSNISSLLTTERTLVAKSRNMKVVANIPFNINKDVVKQLLPMGDISQKLCSYFRMKQLSP